MLKRIISLSLCILMIFSLSSCATNTVGSDPSAPLDSAIYKAGEYTASAKGNFGDIPVTVTFSDTEILSIIVGENQETPDIAKPVFEKLPKQIIDGQTLKVDMIAGATNSCKGLLDAVEDCIKIAPKKN
ncbi:FMN-binding protein [Sedimentibacter hydroxybenzoicus DSM 7310]|uniref:FMN-binding protein n=1 Tax=Sedimentibacter hydroxybenzoicus DSM 7310 TaxID=1123245 RepID=A0A974BGH0_SEDHY|nr:FMN-binding protein [Sedimentibacter hydroxybenzoicus]NYB72689.1 FMN-binding protein [Sedimentibacter hydroxybenzoicus DSM 7310]